MSNGGKNKKAIGVADLAAPSVRYAVLAVATVAMVFPLVWLLLSAMKTTPEIQAHPFALPARLSLANFVEAWRVGRFSDHFLSSAVVSACSVGGLLLIGSMAGFAFARFRIPAADLLFALFMIGLVLPVESIVFPLKDLTETLGIADRWPALIGPYIALEMPLAIYVFRSFFASIPREMEESARLDGCNLWQMYWRVFLPMAAPAISVVGILVFLSVWNEFLLANFLITDERFQTLPAAFNNFYARHTRRLDLIFAGLGIYITPAIAVYLVFSKAITRSLAGAVKG